MKIFYFSGTGNSYHIAKKISNSFDDNTELIKIKDNNYFGVIEDKIVGIVFPIYYFGLPVLVEEFIRKINISKDTYLFIIVTKGVSLGGGVKTQLEKLFQGKKKYNYFQYITMGDNFVLDFWDATPPQKTLIRNEKSNKEIIKITKAIKNQQDRKKYAFIDYFYFITKNIPRYGYKTYKQNIYLKDSFFVVDKKQCMLCKKCEKSCPVNNIKITTKVEWKHENCQMCLACFHCCPRNAVQYENKEKNIDTKNKSQYWNF